MLKSEIKNRAASEISKWLLVQINNGIIPDGEMSWSYHPTDDSTWNMAASALVAVNLVEGNKTSSEVDSWDYKTTGHYFSIPVDIEVSNNQFQKLLSAFISVGDFLGYMSNEKGEGFKVSAEVEGLFSDLSKLGYTHSKSGLYYWRKAIYPVAYKSSLYTFWRPDVENRPPGTWTLTHTINAPKKNSIKSKIRNTLWWWFK